MMTLVLFFLAILSLLGWVLWLLVRFFDSYEQIYCCSESINQTKISDPNKYRSNQSELNENLLIFMEERLMQLEKKLAEPQAKEMPVQEPQDLLVEQSTVLLKSSVNLLKLINYKFKL